MPTLQLIPSGPEFAEHWQTWRNEATTQRFNPVMPLSIEELRTRMKQMSSDLSDLKAAEEFQFILECGGEPVGTFTLKGISHMMQYAEIGYGITEKLQGKGIGSRALRMFVDKVFAETSLRRLYANVAEDNLASRRVLEKNGFQQEGILREHYMIHGKPTNEVVYGLLRSELR